MIDLWHHNNPSAEKFDGFVNAAGVELRSISHGYVLILTIMTRIQSSCESWTQQLLTVDI